VIALDEIKQAIAHYVVVVTGDRIAQRLPSCQDLLGSRRDIDRAYQGCRDPDACVAHATGAYRAWDGRFSSAGSLLAPCTRRPRRWRLQLPNRVLAAMLSFAAGALVTALTFERFQTPTSKEAMIMAARISISMQRRRTPLPSPASVSGAACLALLAAATTLDGIPEILCSASLLGKVAAAWRWPPSLPPIPGPCPVWGASHTPENTAEPCCTSLLYS